MFPARPRLGFISPPILLCETIKGSEFEWIKTTKRKVIMINDWTSGDGRGHLTIVTQSSSIAAITAE